MYVGLHIELNAAQTALTSNKLFGRRSYGSSCLMG